MGDRTLTPTHPAQAVTWRNDTSPHTAWASRDPGIWVPNGFGVVRAGLRSTSGSTGSLSPVSKVEAQDYYAFVEWRRRNCRLFGSKGGTSLS